MILGCLQCGPPSDVRWFINTDMKRLGCILGYYPPVSSNVGGNGKSELDGAFCEHHQIIAAGFSSHF